MTLKVGSIVICHGWDEVEGKKGFIEEVISDPALGKTGLIWSGRYSIYGLEEVDFDSGAKYYFGSFLGADLEETNEAMSVKDLEQFLEQNTTDKLLQKDIPIIIQNLGRETGMNEGTLYLTKEFNKDG